MDADRIALLLPEVYRRAVLPGSPLAAVLDVMADLHAPVEDLLGRFPDVLHPYTAPEQLVPFLARWVDLHRWLDQDVGELPTGNGRLRVLLAHAARLAAERGTARGLQRALVLALGMPGVVVDDDVAGPDGAPVPFVVRVVLPAQAADYAELVERIVREEKPAHVAAEVVYAEVPDGPPGPSTDAAPDGPA